MENAGESSARNAAEEEDGQNAGESSSARNAAVEGGHNKYQKGEVGHIVASHYNK